MKDFSWGAILMKMAIFFKENVSRVADFLWGVILMKMAVFSKEIVSRVADFLKRFLSTQ